MVKCREFFPRYVLGYILFAPIVVAVIVMFYIFCIQSPVKTQTVFDVVRGDSVTGVANRLAANHLIDSKDLFIASVLRRNPGRSALSGKACSGYAGYD